MRIIREFRLVVAGLWSLVVGLFITGKNFALPQLTVHYPRQAVPNLDTYRGHIELVAKDNDPTQPRCLACQLCATACPSQCIKIVIAKETVDKEQPPAKKAPKKRPEAFYLNYNLCSLCGMCVQSCPADSLMFSRDVYLAGYARQDFEYDLMERMRTRDLRLVPAEGSGVAKVWEAPALSRQVEDVSPRGTEQVPSEKTSVA